jgi:hypothetical protein
MKSTLDTLKSTATAFFNSLCGLEKAKTKLGNAARDAAVVIVAADRDGKDGLKLFQAALVERGMEERAASSAVSGNIRPFLPAARAASDPESGFDALELRTLTQRDAKAAFRAAGGAKAEREGGMTSAAWVEGLAEARAAAASNKADKRADARAAAAPMTARERVAAAIAANLPALTPEDRAALRAMLS